VSYGNALQHTATQYNTLQRIAACCNTLHTVAPYCTTMQHTAPHCTTLQHAAARCNTLQHAAIPTVSRVMLKLKLQYTATRCNTLQHTATHCNTLQLPQHPRVRHELEFESKRDALFEEMFALLLSGALFSLGSPSLSQPNPRQCVCIVCMYTRE